MPDTFAVLKFEATDALAKKFTENLGTIDADPLFADSDTAIAYAKDIDNFCRGIIGLTTNTYLNVSAEIDINITHLASEGD